jgi:hypothetical protein
VPPHREARALARDQRSQAAEADKAGVHGPHVEAAREPARRRPDGVSLGRGRERDRLARSRAKRDADRVVDGEGGAEPVDGDAQRSSAVANENRPSRRLPDRRARRLGVPAADG